MNTAPWEGKPKEARTGSGSIDTVIFVEDSDGGTLEVTCTIEYDFFEAEPDLADVYFEVREDFSEYPCGEPSDLLEQVEAIIAGDLPSYMKLRNIKRVTL